MSLKERMANTVEPADRVMSTNPTGSWLDGLRASFDPESNAKQNQPQSEQTPALLAGRLRSA